MTKILELTEEQIALQKVYRDKWIEIGLCTDPANRQDAERAIKLMYKQANFKEPKKIIWCDSPLAAAITKYIISNGKIAR
jgi:hypothetical protein